MFTISIILMVIFIALCFMIKFFHDQIKSRPVLKVVVTWGALASLLACIVNGVISIIVR